MKQETNINLRMVDNLNNVKVMKQEIKQANEIAKQDLINRSKEQSSLEKGVIKLKSFVCEPKTLPRDHNTFNLDDCEQAIIVALADQKAKMIKLFEYWDMSRGAYILPQKYRDELKEFIFTGKTKGLEFEELK